MTASIRSPAAPPLDDDNLLSEILLRLSPQPPSLPRASVVCKRWLSLVSDPGFFRRFRLHHSRNPPLLGFINPDPEGRRLSFVPALDAPNRVPVGRFSLHFRRREIFRSVSRRHGLVLILLHKRLQFLVWDPVTGKQHRIAIPSGFDMEETPISASVLRAAGVVHHFQVVMVLLGNQEKQDTLPVARIYSSETGVWSPVISTPLPHEAADSLLKPELQSHRRRLFSALVSSHRFSPGIRAALIGNSLYWLLPIGILEFDLERQSLAMVPVRGDMCVKSFSEVSVMRAEGGGLGLFTLSDSHARAQLWKRETNCEGLASWVLRRTIELDNLLPVTLEGKIRYLWVAGFVEYNNVVLLSTPNDSFIVQLDSLEVKKLSRDETRGICHFRPFESVYPAENVGRLDVADLPQNT